jgi:hypothetical protein
MKATINVLSTLLLAALFLSATPKGKIEEYYISFNALTDLTPAEPDMILKNAEKYKIVNTNLGEVKVTRLEGYKITYNTKQKLPSVNLKVELSDKKSYEKDKMNLINNIRFISANNEGMESSEMIELESNGYKVYGYSKTAIDKVGTLGTFVMFPGDNVVVYFEFNNISTESAFFKTTADYKKQREAFIQEYTKHIKAVKDELLAQEELKKAKKNGVKESKNELAVSQDKEL